MMTESFEWSRSGPVLTFHCVKEKRGNGDENSGHYPVPSRRPPRHSQEDSVPTSPVQPSEIRVKIIEIGQDNRKWMW